MKSDKGLKLVNKILDDINRNGIIINTLISDLKELRPYAVEKKQPVLAKAIRLTTEHLEATGTFSIPIPEDEPIEEPEMEEEETKTESVDPEESLSYLLSLIRDSENRLNLTEIRDYNAAMEEYAEIHEE